MPYSCWTTATSKWLMAAAAARQPAVPRAGQVCTTPMPGRSSSIPVVTRTTPSGTPSALRWLARAELKVARPHCVGGWVLRKPYEGARSRAFRLAVVSAHTDPASRDEGVTPDQRVWRAERVQERLPRGIDAQPEPQRAPQYQYRVSA